MGAGTSQLGIYNLALRICNERRLQSLAEDRPPRYYLDQVWNEGGVDACLESAQWHFATRAVRVDSDPQVTTNFGLTYGFSKPSDWLRTCGMTSDERFMVPYRMYKDEPGFWYADITPIYALYISNDPAFGKNLSIWPMSFVYFVGSFFAFEIAHKLTSDKERIALVEKELIKARRDAKNKDAMNEATGIPFRGSWSRARSGGRTPWRDGGNRGSLIG